LGRKTLPPHHRWLHHPGTRQYRDHLATALFYCTAHPAVPRGPRDQPQDRRIFSTIPGATGDLFLGDRGYARREGISHVLQGGGQVLVRTNLTNLPLVVQPGVPFPLLEHLRTLTGTELGDWEVYVPHNGQLIPGRICALKKNKLATEKARRRARESSRKQGYRPRPETLEAAAYTFVFTTLPKDEFKPAKILEMYRGRWQVELAFKRLKSLLGLGHLKKSDAAVAQAWLQGKLLVAFLIEALIASAERFFPWGYPLSTEAPPMSVERNLAYGSSG